MDTSAMAAVAGEGIMLAGGMRAILLQVAHPAVGQGVAEHSHFTDRPMDRLRATMTYVYCMAFGSPAEKRAICDRVDRVHGVVKGGDYDARDPDLQLWVAATLYDTSLTLYERWVARLDEAMADRVYQQYRIMGTALQMRDSQWPADRQAFQDYWNGELARIQVTDAARGICRDLLYARRIPPWLRALMPLTRLVTVALLPACLRDAYGLEWNADRARRFQRVSSTIGFIYPRLPARLRQLPRFYYLRDMRRRLDA